jgi:hypothetical protein
VLKKDLMTPGTRLRVLPVIKNGLPANMGGSEEKPYLLMTPEAGALFEERWGIPSGALLTVIDGPKRRSGINTIIVRTEDGQEGHVFWCEARASCEAIVPRAVRHDADTQRIMLDGEMVAIALRLSNGRWGLYGAGDERKLTNRTWAKPAEVAEAYGEFADVAGKGRGETR